MLTVHNINIAVTILKMNLSRNSRKNCIKAKGNYPDRAHSDQMVLGIVTRRGSSGLSPLRPGGSSDGKAGRLDHVSGGQKTLRTMLNLKRDFQARVHSGQMVLMVVRKRGWTA
jgi:hypothetical protein